MSMWKKMAIFGTTTLALAACGNETTEPAEETETPDETETAETPEETTDFTISGDVGILVASFFICGKSSNFVAINEV